MSLPGTYRVVNAGCALNDLMPPHTVVHARSVTERGPGLSVHVVPAHDRRLPVARGAGATGTGRGGRTAVKDKAVSPLARVELGLALPLSHSVRQALARCPV